MADPARLDILDTLSLGDASPTDLRARLGVSSNLLAHHLRVLQDVGLVVRHRSEADRRRTYVQLAPSVLNGLLPDAALPHLGVPRIVFVCTANSARSQLAAALWHQASSIPAASAGTHPADAIAPGAVAVARRHGLRITQTHPRRLDEVRRPDDYLITVCDNAHEELQRRDQIQGATNRLHWSVPDPVQVDTDDAFDVTFDDLAQRITHLAPRLAPSSNS